MKRQRGDNPNTIIAGSGFVLSLLLGLVLWGAILAVNRPIMRLDNQPAVPARWPDMRVNINTATAAELTVLPGIGPRLAHAIVEDRETNGEFHELDDLQRVRMIGPITVERIEPYVLID